MIDHDLLAAYALDALPADESEQFETHLAGCRECRAELSELSAATAQLAAGASAAPPDGLRARVLGSIAPRVVPDRRRLWLRVLVPAVAVLAVAVLALAALLGSVDRRSAVDDALRRVVAAPDGSLVVLEGEAASAATFVFSTGSGEGVLLVEGLPQVAGDETYQFWLIDETGPRSAGVFSAAGGDAALVVAADLGAVTALGVTVEPAGGSPQPTGEIILFAGF